MPSGFSSPASAGPAAGSYLPAATQSGFTLDTTTYTNPVTGAGKLALVLAAADTPILAGGLTGDPFLHFFVNTQGDDLLYAGNGTVNPYVSGAFFGVDGSTTPQGWQSSPLALIAAASKTTHTPRMNQLSPKFTITAGALPTVALVSATGAQILTTRDTETITPFTGDGTNNAATCAIALSPDNVTYSTVATISIAAALNLTGVLTDTVNARVPAGWYLKLTAVHGTIGTTTYY